MHCSGKEEILRHLRSLQSPKGVQDKIKIGRIFTNLENIEARKDIYLPNTVYYDNQDIVNTFEVKAYIYLTENTYYTYPFYEGLSQAEYDSNDVFILTPSQVNQISYLDPKNTCFVWIDTTLQARKDRYEEEGRTYNFDLQEKKDASENQEFIDRIYDCPHVLYFFNEDPARIASLLSVLLLYPKTFPLIDGCFN